jgi:hypothetical protein
MLGVFAEFETNLRQMLKVEVAASTSAQRF